MPTTQPTLQHVDAAVRQDGGFYKRIDETANSLTF